MKKTKTTLTFICLLLIFLFLPNIQGEAASTKTKALKAYAQFLSQDKIAWDETGSYSVNAQNCSFAVVCIDKNAVPELVVINWTDNFHVGGYGALFGYVDGSVKYISHLQIDGDFYYYKKKGIYVDSHLTMGINNVYYEKLSKGNSSIKLQYSKEIYDMNEDGKLNYYYQYSSDMKYKTISKIAFNKQLKKMVGSCKKTKVSFQKNTKANCRKYLK